MIRIFGILLVLLLTAYAAAEGHVHNLEARIKTITYPDSGQTVLLVTTSLAKLDPASDLSPYQTPITAYSEKSRWILRRKKKGAGDDFKPIQIQSAHLFDEKGAQFEVMVGERVSKGDELQIGVRAQLKNSTAEVDVYHGEAAQRSNLKMETDFEPYLLDFDPGFQQEQKLIDGKTATVGQLDVKFKMPLANALSGLTVLSDNKLSTDRLDSASKLSLALERQWSLDNFELVPAFVSVGVTGNQAWTNASFIAELGLRPTVLAVGNLGTRKVIQEDGTIKEYGSTPPTIKTSLQYFDWMKRDVRVQTDHAEKRSIRVAAEFDLSTLYLANYGNNLTGYATLRAVGWYFPDPKATAGRSVRRFEGLIDASLWFQVSRANCIRLRYVTGAQDTNNFVRTASFGIFFEAVK